MAGLFLALTGAALVLSGRFREGLALGIGASIATLAVIVAFPVGGVQPFGLSSFWWVAVACGIAVVVIPSELRALRIGIALYTVLLIGVFFVAHADRQQRASAGSHAPGPA